MSLTGRIARSTMIQIVGKGIAVFFGIAGISILTRHLGQSGFGAYTTVISFVQFFGTLADLGLYVVSLKKISEHGVDTDRIFNNLFTLRIVSALVFVVGTPLVVLLFPYPPEVKIGVAVVSMMNLFITLSQVLMSVFQRALAMARTAIAEVIGKAGFLLLVVLFTAQNLSLTWILIATVAGSGVQCLLLLFFARRHLRIRFAYDRTIWADILRESWPVALSVALNLIYFRADTIILSLFHSQATVGLYGASYKVLEVLVAFPAMFAGLIIPLVTLHVSRGDHEQFRATLQKGFDFLTTLGLPIVVGIFVLAHPIMALIAGNEFVESGSILRVLIFAVGVIFLGTMFGYTVVVVNRQRAMIKYYLGVAIFSIAGYFLFIPPYSVWGAAGMTVATESAIMLASFYVVWKTTRASMSLRQAGRAACASIVMGIAVYALRTSPLALSVSAGLAVYAVALAVCGGLQREMIREMIRLR